MNDIQNVDIYMENLEIVSYISIIVLVVITALSVRFIYKLIKKMKNGINNIAGRYNKMKNDNSQYYKKINYSDLFLKKSTRKPKSFD